MRSVSETDRHGDKMRRICQNNAFCRDKGQGWHIDFGKICAGERPMSEETAEIIIRISRILDGLRTDTSLSYYASADPDF